MHNARALLKRQPVENHATQIITPNSQIQRWHQWKSRGKKNRDHKVEIDSKKS